MAKKRSTRSRPIQGHREKLTLMKAELDAIHLEQKRAGKARRRE